MSKKLIGPDYYAQNARINEIMRRISKCTTYFAKQNQNTGAHYDDLSYTITKLNEIEQHFSGTAQRMKAEEEKQRKNATGPLDLTTQKGRNAYMNTPTKNYRS